MKYLRKLILACVVILTVSSCSTVPLYRLPSESTANCATIFQSESSLGVYEVDGIRAVTTWQVISRDLPSETKLAPGKHTIVTIMLNGGADVFTSLWLVAEPNKRYLLRQEFTGNNMVHFWFEDLSNGKVLVGLTGSVDEPAK